MARKPTRKRRPTPPRRAERKAEHRQAGESVRIDVDPASLFTGRSIREHARERQAKKEPGR